MVIILEKKINERSSIRLNGKDLITIGIFSSIYFVINIIFMMLGIIPVMWILMPGFIALFSGIPFMLLCTKVQKPGAVLIMGFITGFIYFITGQFTAIILITFTIGCVLGEVLRGITKYNSFKGNAVAFALFSLGMTGSPLPIWIFRDSFFVQITKQGMSLDYINSLQKLASNEMLIVLFVAPIIGAVISSIVTSKIFKKHFVKAGIV
ncbi:MULTISPECIES: MptD family putative ECF transporter S component [unclassified Clostridium]|uniref:MptD family putative ECF transporter S component n=1 Tax=unclassified Clostridium TaxID=2614128 RepID=UPI00196A1566